MEAKKEQKNVKTGAELLVDGLAAGGVKVVFGVPGGAAIPLYDALYLHGAGMRFVLTRHEQGAAHMADGYARATGRLAAVLVTGGPGATNTVTGIMTAYMDSVPMVVVTGQSDRAMLGKDAFQETDVFNLMMPIVKHSYLVKSAAEIPRVVAEACHIATTGRPGPVLLDVPRDVAEELAEGPGEGEAVAMSLPGYHPVARAYGRETLEQVAAVLKEARRPAILAGHGVVLAGASAALRALAEKLEAPVTTTLLGKGVFPDGHRLCLGMPGVYGGAGANLALSECDVLLAVGARLDERVTAIPERFGRDATVIHVDVDAAEFGKMVQADVCVEGDARAVLEDLLPLVEKCDSGEWLKRLAACRRRFEATTGGGASERQPGGIRPLAVLRELRAQTSPETVLATDVGLHQMWAAQAWSCAAPGQFLTSGGGGTMGFGLPAAIGAQLGRPGTPVVAVVGDGGFQMTLCELATMVVQKLPIKVFVMNNHYLGMVRQLQDIFREGHFSGVELEGNPDFAALAKAYGATGLSLRRHADIRKVVRKALATEGPVVVNVEVARREEVFPIVPPGHPLNEMVFERPRRGRGRPAGGSAAAAAAGAAEAAQAVTDITKEVH